MMICASTFLSSSGLIALTLPCVPTGMKTGVSTQPCRVVNRPSRAREFGSVLRSWKDILGTETEYGRCSADSPDSRAREVQLGKDAADTCAGSTLIADICRIVGKDIDLGAPVFVVHIAFAAFSRKYDPVTTRPVVIAAVPLDIQ